MPNDPVAVSETTQLERLCAAARLDAVQGERLLELRAIALAQRPEERDTLASRIEVVIFRAGGTVFAVPSRAVDLVREIGKIVPLPMAAPVLRGVIVHRAELIAAADLAQLFEGQPSARSSSARLIVLAHEGQRLAIVSDELIGVRALDRSVLAPAPSTFPAELTRYIEGIAADGVTLLSAQSLLSDLLPP